MDCEEAQLLLKQLLGMLPSNYWCAILILHVPLCNEVYRRVVHTQRFNTIILLHSSITMGCEKVQLLLKQLLGMLPSNNWGVILN
jgi:hypothetical protein